MPTTKPGYKGDITGNLLPEFSDALKKNLRAYYPNKNADEDPVFGHPADEFVSHILSEAWWAKSTLHQHKHESTKSEILAEHADLLRCLRKAEDKLRKISPDFHRCLADDTDPLGCADRIKELVISVEKATDSIRKAPPAKKPAEKQFDVAIELAIRVLRILNEYGIKASATGNSYDDYTSDAVKILKLIGDDMALVYAPLTWRDKIIEAKDRARDIQ